MKELGRLSSSSGNIKQLLFYPKTPLCAIGVTIALSSTSLFSSPRSVLASTVRCKLASFCIRCNSRMTALLFSCASANSALACSWAHKPYSPAKQTDTGRQLAGSLRPLPGVLWLMSPAAPSATGTTATSFVRCDEQLRDVVALAVQRRTCSP